MEEDPQAKFLIAEYANVYDTLYKNMDNWNHSIRLFFTLLTASVAAVLVGATKQLPTATVLRGAATLSALFFLICAFGSWLLVWSVGSTVAKLRAINAIRRHFLDLDPHKAKYFSLPVSDSGPLFSAIPGRASLFFTMFMSGLFAAVSCACWLIAATVWVWYAVVVAVLAAVGVWSALVSYIRYCQRHIDSETTSTSRLPTEVSLADNTGAD
jgi:hypothetical protein